MKAEMLAKALHGLPSLCQSCLI